MKGLRSWNNYSSSKLSITETTESRAVLNICEYVFSVSSIFVCPKYFATNVTLAPLLINNDAHECHPLSQCWDKCWHSFSNSTTW